MRKYQRLTFRTLTVTVWTDCVDLRVAFDSVNCHSHNSHWRRAASAAYAVIVCPAVCLSATSRYCIETTGRFKLVLAWVLPSTCPMHYVISKFESPPQKKTMVLPSGTSSQTLDLENFVTASRSCCQRNLSTIELVDNTYDGRHVVAGRT